jgi:HSP20 family protein
MATGLTRWEPFAELAELRKEEKDKQFVRRERRYGSFSRSIPLPRGVDPEQIEADYQDGVLEVSIPMPAEEEGKKIQIRSQERE